MFIYKVRLECGMVGLLEESDQESDQEFYGLGDTVEITVMIDLIPNKVTGKIKEFLFNDED
jgi:hypothetical protein